ncbi:putative phospholipid-binding protein [Singulisphaera acidiphila DSM 18658]|uniref:Putative phospholipid-binding protein n=1 Tax=Singulisphaera acidiphila (strain ATCC BAA-1392 / DSM 18658 / VKM B-2454 / MOB10) TaxID=886293 RepID=L0DL73_SINAD|nr:putative phospholipid-binding protein [Singulisphaera acidiphila DSM 18658]
MIGQASTLDTGCATEAYDSVRTHLMERQIAHRAFGRIYDLHVDCSGGRVVLQGRCRTYHTKQLAHEAALDLAESSARVDNQIVVG